MSYQKELLIARQAAVLAGEKILEVYSREFSFKEKADNQGPVTEADLLANDIICSLLSKEFPDDYIISEEKEDDIVRLKKNRLWCIDPLDGTKDFLMKNDEFSVHIGLIENNKAVLGVVYLPVFNKMYYGIPGQGSFLVENGLETKLITTDHDMLEDMIMIGSRSHRDKYLQSFLDSTAIKSEIIHGSVGAKIGLIAEGKADFLIYFSNQTKEWDICAPQAILLGAKGIVTDIYGNDINYNKEALNNPGGILASNNANHQLLIKKTSSIKNEDQ